jgi:peptidoglycan/xylan/chitin deacetylase (PgdA/CDA1 family)
MRWLPFVLGRSRGLRNTATRLPTILQRFGWTAHKSEVNLQILLDIADRYGVHPTFAITAVTARRHPQVVRRLLRRGAELAAHGLVHNDYAALTGEEQRQQVRRACHELASLGVDVRGWRSPYFRWNADMLAALVASGLRYDATPVYVWPVYEEENIALAPAAKAAYDRLCALFSAQDARCHVVLPTIAEGLVRIPSSLPQDEDMVDRLHLDAQTMTRIWCRVLHETRDRGELFVVNLHPERAALCAKPLDALLRQARRLGDVWIPTLGEIATWWRERDGAHVTVQGAGNSCWQMVVGGPARLAVTCGARACVGPGSLLVTSSRKPVIHCGPAWPESTRQRLRDAGYVTEYGEADGRGYALDLDGMLPPDSPADSVVRYVQVHSGNLLRLEPWPAAYRSCLSITGDIDALTLIDFALRLKEF